jgi:hypothetical protein
VGAAVPADDGARALRASGHSRGQSERKHCAVPDTAPSGAHSTDAVYAPRHLPPPGPAGWIRCSRPRARGTHGQLNSMMHPVGRLVRYHPAPAKLGEPSLELARRQPQLRKS